MRLRQLELRDVGPFGDYQVDFTGRLVGIVGRNGSGKSTILSMIHYLITNDGSRLGQRDAVAVKRKYPGDQPFGRLTFLPVEGGIPAVVTRWLPDGQRDSKRRLVWDEQSWTIQQDLSRQFQQWLSVSEKTMTEFIFIEQGRLAAIVDDRPADRAKTLHRLFGLEEAEKAREIAMDHLATLPTPADPEVLAQLRARYAEARANLATTEEELQKLPDLIDGEDADQQTVEEYENQISRFGELSKLRGQLEVHQRRLDQPELQKPEPQEAANYAAIIRSWSQYRVSLTAYNNYQTRLEVARRNQADCQKQLETAAIPVQPGPNQEFEQLTVRRYALETILSAPEAGGSCPICNGPLVTDLADREKAQASFSRLQELEYERLCDESKYQRDRIHYESCVREKTTADSAVSGVLCGLSPLQPVPPPSVSLSDAELLLSDHRERTKAAITDVAEREASRNQVTSLERRIEQFQAFGEISEADVIAARQRMIERATRELRRRELEARASGLRESFESAERLLHRTEANGATSARIEQHRQEVVSLRNMFHRDAIPALATRGCLEDLAGDLNRSLARLKASFRIKVREDGELLAEFHDGTSSSTIRATRISKGERAVLGLAWSVAAAERYAPQVKLLCLDEPTDGLDRERITALKSALEAWRDSDDTSQMLVVTHERGLMGVFDRFIELP